MQVFYARVAMESLIPNECQEWIVFTKSLCLLCLFSTMLLAGNTIRDETAFHAGPAIAGFGRIATVKTDVPIPKDTELKIRFDVDKAAAPGTINRTFDSAARFINLHVAAGVPPEKIKIAIVVHGSASVDVTRQDFYKALNEDRGNASAAAIETLAKHQVQFYLCGQSAAYNDIGNADLLPGVKMALSAMTMHVLLDQDGYSLIPF